MKPLTPLEERTLAAYAETGDYLEAARRLGIPAPTWRNRASRAYRKLGVNGAISAFRELGWLVLPFETRATGWVASGMNVQAVALT